MGGWLTGSDHLGRVVAKPWWQAYLGEMGRNRDLDFQRAALRAASSHDSHYLNSKRDFESMAICTYTGGEYLEKNPTWHVEDSPWKAENVFRLIAKHRLPVKTVAEVGCGAGEILVQLQRALPDDCELSGYDISPQSHEMAVQRSNDRLEFHLADLTEERGVHFDLLVIADLIEHLDDYYSFLRKVKPLAEHTILHIPLDLSAYTVIRSHYLHDQRRNVGHIHYFSKDIALASLEEAGFEVVDWFYPTPQRDREIRPFRQHVLGWMRKLSYALNPDLSVKALGGRSLMVLVR